jgi:16S rRNA (cytosine1402-N4)-methyltransferase
MPSEVLDALQVVPGGRYIDATLGEGGHARAILHSALPGGQMIGIDADPAAVASAEKRLERFGSSIRLVNENFAEMQAIATRYDFAPVHGILMDLGVSSLQLDREARGFSFRRADPLDMRFSRKGRLDANEIVNHYTGRELSDLIYSYGGERASRRIASAIVENRPVKDTLQLAEIISAVKPRGRSRIHSATQTFQALRIAVNDELAILRSGLEQAVNALGKGGRLVVISYHSLEDRIVKNFLRNAATDCICDSEARRAPVCACDHVPTLELVINGALTPSASEVKANPRSRSAKLRVARRI